LIAAPHVAAVG